MAGPSDNIRCALRGHLSHLPGLIDKVHEICRAGGGSSIRFNYLHCPDGQIRGDIVRSLEDLRQEVNQAAAHWGIDLRAEQIDAMHALIVALQFVEVAPEGMSSSRLSGFGVHGPAFEKDYAEFLLRLRIRLAITQRFVGNRMSDTPSSG